ncbi:hypothetical protein [Thioflavicoccus mobilis]|nr:hypothetical protein [Thioflavicoccus mobilis]
MGGDHPARGDHLERVLNGARFLILPWVQVKSPALVSPRAGHRDR